LGKAAALQPHSKQVAMNNSRRNFINAMLGLSVLAINSKAEDAVKIINHNAANKAVIIEGKDLLVTIKFPFAVSELSGNLHMKITPAAAGGGFFIETQTLFFYGGNDDRTFHSILTAPLDVVATSYPLMLVAKTKSGEKKFEFPYVAQIGRYRAVSFTLSKSFSNPSPEEAARARQDFEVMASIYKRRTPQKWSGNFIEPVKATHKGNFGEKRTINNTKRYRHAGLDYRAGMGTPVRAINDAEVALSTEHLVAGQIVCLDHGGGIFSKYIHLSKRNVNTGDKVKKGDVIGLVGNSGNQKVGAHLHLDIVVNGTHVEPQDFMRVAALLAKMQ
jgi:murein DD-endopeptidase MepM/ murein hydrolase activator NlpD